MRTGLTLLDNFRLDCLGLLIPVCEELLAVLADRRVAWIQMTSPL